MAEDDSGHVVDTVLAATFGVWRTQLLRKFRERKYSATESFGTVLAAAFSFGTFCSGYFGWLCLFGTFLVATFGFGTMAAAFCSWYSMSVGKCQKLDAPYTN